MAHTLDVEQWQDELVDAFKLGEEERARALVAQPGPRKARALLEAMLERGDGLARQAAAWGLGELGGASSARRLEQQLALEEAREDYDSSAVAEVITQALGRLKAASTRAPLVRRLQRLAANRASFSDVNVVARMLWHKRHAALLPVVRQALAQLAPSDPNSLHGLLVLLEKSPEELDAWVQDMSVPVEQKTGVVTVLEEEVPDDLKPTLPTFISLAQTLLDAALGQRGVASYYCERLFILFILQEQNVLPTLPSKDRAALHAVARTLVGSRALGCAMRALNLLQSIGTPEDAAHIEAHRPEDSTFAAAFDETALFLRHRKP